MPTGRPAPALLVRREPASHRATRCLKFHTPARRLSSLVWTVSTGQSHQAHPHSGEKDDHADLFFHEYHAEIEDRRIVQQRDLSHGRCNHWTPTRALDQVSHLGSPAALKGHNPKTLESGPLFVTGHGFLVMRSEADRQLTAASGRIRLGRCARSSVG